MKSVDELLKHFNVSDTDGLSQEAVEESLEKYGLNGKNSFFILNHLILQGLVQCNLNILEFLTHNSFLSLFNLQNCLPKKGSHYGKWF